MRVLLIDDELAWLEEATRILRTLGAEIAINLGARGAVFASFVFKPDLILLDLNMPDLTGTWLLSELRKSKARIFFCSDVEPGRLKALARVVGADGIISKSEARAAGKELRRLLEKEST